MCKKNPNSVNLPLTPSPFPRFRGRWRKWTFVASLTTAVLTGCASHGTGAASPTDLDPKGVFSPAATASLSSAGADCAGVWTVLIHVFDGDDATAQAQRLLAIVQQQADLQQATIEQRRIGVAVTLGAFRSHDAKNAQRTLAMVRDVEMEGQRPFQNAILLPPPQTASLGAYPQWTLHNVREQAGPAAVVYTLQIAVYESNTPQEACAAAEQAVVALRKDGEEAYYHHGLGRSIVTEGVFSPSDFDLVTHKKSKALEALQQRHPYNLFNGRTRRVQGPDGQWREDPSALVVVP